MGFCYYRGCVLSKDNGDHMILDIWIFITMLLDEYGRMESEGKVYG